MLWSSSKNCNQVHIIGSQTEWKTLSNGRVAAIGASYGSTL